MCAFGQAQRNQVYVCVNQRIEQEGSLTYLSGHLQLFSEVQEARVWFVSHNLATFGIVLLTM